MTTQTQVHVNDKFFAKAARYFGGLSSALTEIMQNAYRASLPMVTADYKPTVKLRYEELTNSLRVTDEGRGVTDVGAMLSIADSRWGEGVEEEQDPAGMGMCGVMASCQKLKIRSAFGSLLVDCDQFFNSPEYRATVLDDIDPNGSTVSGTEVTMLGLRETWNNSLVKSIARYHAAVRVELDGKEVENVLSDCQPMVREGTADPLTYRGYNVYSYKHTFGYSRVAPVTLVWHGQLIAINVDAPALRRTVTLPCGEEVLTRFSTGIGRGLLVVVDHGAAPVTPRLPDRSSLVYDEKTVEFLWGLALPFLEQSIKEYDAYLQEKKAKGLHNYYPSAFDRMSSSFNLPKSIRYPLCRRRLAARYVELPTLGDGPHSAARAWVDMSESCYALFPNVVLRYVGGDTRVLDAGTTRLSGEDPLTLMFLHGVDGSQYAGVSEHENSLIPEGLVYGVVTDFGANVQLPVAVMVVDIPGPAPVTTYGRSHIENVLTDAPLNVTLHIFSAENGADVEDIVDRIHRDDRIGGLLDGADAVNEAVISGITATVGAPSYDVDDHLWVGQRRAAIDTTYSVEAAYEQHDWNGCDEHPSTREISGWFDVLRRDLGDAASVRAVLGELLTATVGYFNPRSVSKIELDHENGVIRVHTGDEVLTQRIKL